MTIPKKMLQKLARQSAATWNAMAAEAFRGEVKLETANTIYRFIDGVFASSAQKPSRSFEYGLWSLSPRWREKSLAVFWRPGAVEDRSIIVTSATVAFALEAPPPAARKSITISGVVRKPESSPPTLRRPRPPSMTRLLPADAHPST